MTLIAAAWMATQAPDAPTTGAARGTDPLAPNGQSAPVAEPPSPPGGPLQGEGGMVPPDDRGPQRPTVAQPSRIEWKNELGKNYRVTEITILLDDRPVLQEQADDKGEVRGPLHVYDGPLAQGTHRIELRAKVMGRNRAMFSYMDNYALDVRSREAFTVSDRPVAFTVAIGERSGRNVPFERRPIVLVRSDTVSPPQGTTNGER